MSAGASAREVADRLFDALDGDIRLALPLGLGKPEALVDALYARAKQDRATSLHIYTALTLEVPRGGSDLERRFLAPLQRGLFANVPVPAWVEDLRARRLPDNVRVSEFFLRPGAWLNDADVQQHYISSNYTHAARDLAARGINVMAQLVARERAADGAVRYSLSCNPDLTLDLRDRLGGQVRLVGELSDALPFMEGDAVLSEADFDAIVVPERPRDLFPVPNELVGLARHAIALRAAALVRDGGTLQIGIGGLGDAVAHAIALRHVEPGVFAALADALDIDGERTPFVEGLYASSEMFVEGFLELRRVGVLTRTVRDGAWLHGGFLLGSRRFYEALQRMDRAERDGIRMSRIGFTNQLLGDEDDRRRDRVQARFLNTAMMVTLAGAVVSDGLEDGRVVSGVGGQFDFVAMAHQLDGARSIIMLPATRERSGRVTSNLVWNYGHETIPRHLRDLVVTEYGVADLRGASDAEVIARLLAITDARFQDELRRTAIDAGKLPRDFEIAPAARRNTPAQLATRLASSGAADRLPWFPLGADYTQTEAELVVALDALRAANARTLFGDVLAGRHLQDAPRFAAALERMGLAHPRGLREHLYRALLVGVLERVVHGSGRRLLGPGY